LESPIHLPVNELLHCLKEEGFMIGVDTYMAMNKLLSGLDPESLQKPELLKMLLCPIFATGKEEQETFYTIFDNLFQTAPPDHKSTPPPKNSKDFILPVPTVRSDNKVLFFGILGVIILSIALAWFIINQKERTKQADDLTLQKIEDLKKESKQIDDIISGRKAVPVTHGNTSESRFRYLQMVSTDLEPYRATWGQRFHSSVMLAGLAIMFSLFGIFLVYEYYQWRRNKLIAKVRKFKEPVLTVPLHIHSKIKIQMPAMFYTIIKAMRKRIERGSMVLDMAETVKESVRQGGRIAPQFKWHTKAPEYLVLIQQDHARNVRSSYFDFLVTSLKKNDVHITRFYYDGDIRRCHNEFYPEGVSLQYLQYHYAGNRLMILGDGRDLITETNNSLFPWTDIFRSWKDRFFFSTRSAAYWDTREYKIGEEFFVFPASIDGISEMTNHIDNESTADHDYWKNQDVLFRLNEQNTTLVSSLKLYFHEYLKDNELTHLMLRWVAACAILPELYWNLTLFLGREISAESHNLLTLEHIELLFRLKWFRDGKIPEKARQQLLEDESVLSKDLQKELSGKIMDILKENVPENKNQLAYDYRNMQIAVLELMQDPESKRKQELLSRLKNSEELLQTNEYLTLSYLNSGYKKLVSYIIPAEVKQVLFKDGLVYKGLRRSLRAGLIFVCILAFYLNIDFNLLNGETITSDSKTYYLDSAYKKADFYTHIAAWSHNYSYPPLFFKGSLAHEYIDSALHADISSVPALENAYVLNYNNGIYFFEQGENDQAVKSWETNRKVEKKIDSLIYKIPVYKRKVYMDSLVRYKYAQEKVWTSFRSSH
jgi:hypothetical protein